MSKMDITARLRLIANMKRGDLFPPPGIDNPEDWATDGWNVGMSKLLLEARADILARRQDKEDLIAVGRALLAFGIVSLAGNLVLIGMLIARWH